MNLQTLLTTQKEKAREAFKTNFVALTREELEFVDSAISSTAKAVLDMMRGEVGTLRGQNKAAKPADHIEEVDERAYDAACRDFLALLAE